MGRFKGKIWVLWLIFFVSLVLRMYYAEDQGFTLDSYLSLNQAESIKETGLPIHRENTMLPPLFYYFIFLFYKSSFLLNLIPAVLFSSVVFAVYYLSLTLSKDENSAMISSFMAAFVPIFFSDSIGSLSPYCIFIPLLFVFFLVFSKIEKKKYVYITIAFAFILPLISSTAIIIVPSLILYLALIKLLNFSIEKKESELVFLSVFVVIWVFLLFFRKAFEIYGLNIFHQNIPVRIIASYFLSASIPGAIAKIGFLPLLFGIASIYNKIFQPKEKSLFLLISFVLTTAFLLWQKLIELNLALIFIGLSLSVLASISIRDFVAYVKKVRISNAEIYAYLFMISIIFLSSFIPSLAYSFERSKNSDTGLTNSLAWLKSDVESNMTILASPDYGYAIKYISKKESLLDNSFLLNKNANLMYEDAVKIYSTPFETDALALLNKYNVNYLLFDEKIGNEFSASELKYVLDKNCFEEVYSNSIKIYKIKCVLK
jgi:hypothetical protein